MSKYNNMPINFDISDASRSEIGRLRHLWDRQTPDPADVVVIAWSATVLDFGSHSEGVAVSFYGKSERPQIEHAIEQADGMDVVIFVTEPDYGRFRGRTLDFDAERGFHLRP